MNFLGESLDDRRFALASESNGSAQPFVYSIQTRQPKYSMAEDLLVEYPTIQVVPHKMHSIYLHPSRTCPAFP